MRPELIGMQIGMQSGCVNNGLSDIEVTQIRDRRLDDDGSYFHCQDLKHKTLQFKFSRSPNNQRKNLRRLGLRFVNLAPTAEAGATATGQLSFLQPHRRHISNGS